MQTDRKTIYLVTCLLIGLVVLSVIFFRKLNARTPHQEAERLQKLCDNKRKELCYTDEFSQLTKNNTLEYSIQVLSALQNIDSSVRGCHFIGHVIAKAEVEKNPERWEDVISRISVTDCTGGFLMGVMEGHKHYDHTFTLNEKTMLSMCNLVKEKSNEASEQTCNHIMGHLLLVDTDGDVENAIDTCRKTPPLFQYECYSGVFMEQEIRRNLVMHGIGKQIPWTKETTANQEKLCKQYKGIAAQACWRELSHMVVYIAKSYPPDVYKYCMSAPEQQFRNECYIHAVGIMTVSSRFNPENISLLCESDKLDEETMRKCITIAINTMLESSSKLTSQATTLCKSLPDTFQKNCILTISKKQPSSMLQ